MQPKVVCQGDLGGTDDLCPYFIQVFDFPVFRELAAYDALSRLGEVDDFWGNVQIGLGRKERFDQWSQG